MTRKALSGWLMAGVTAGAVGAAVVTCVVTLVWMAMVGVPA